MARKATKKGEKVTDPVAASVCRMIRKAQESKPNQETWRQCESLYRGDAQASIMENGPNQTRPYNIIAPRVDQITASTVGTITSQTPYLLGFLYNSQQKDRDVEAALQFFMERADIETQLEEACPKICTKGLCPVRVTFGTLSNENDWMTPDENLEGDEIVFDTESDKNVGLVIEAIDPDDFIVAPIAIKNLRKAKIVGHRFYLRLAEVIALQEKGVYDKVDIAGGDRPESDDRDDTWSRSQADSAASTDAQDDLVELWEVLVRLPEGKQEKAYRVVVAPTQQVMLKKETYPYSRPWYFDLRFGRELKTFWNLTSIVSKARDVQIMATEGVNILHVGMLFAMQPPVMGDIVPEGQSARYNFGEIMQADIGGTPPFVLPVNFNPSAMPAMLRAYEEKADALMRVSSAGTGQQFKSDTTASEVQAVMAGQQMGANHYIRALGIGMKEMYDFAQELLWKHWDEWYDTYREFVPKLQRDQLKTPIRWELNGRAPDATPMATIQKLGTFMSFATNPAVQQMLMEEAQDPETYRLVGKPSMKEFLKQVVGQLGLNNREKLLPSLAEDDEPTGEGFPGMEALASILPMLQGGNPEAGADMGPGGPGGPVGEGPGAFGLDPGLLGGGLGEEQVIPQGAEGLLGR